MAVKQQLVAQIRAENDSLEQQMTHLRDRMEASKTGGIREFRRTRVGQLEQRKDALRGRIDRLETAAEESTALQTEAASISSELREISKAAANTFK